MKKLLHSQQGVAMMMTLVTMLILSILAAEMVYQNQVYTGIVFRQRDALRAKLLVKSALKLSLLQLRATEKAKAQIKNLGIGDESLANQIWQTPLILPPPTLPGLTPVESQGLEAFKKSLGLDGTLTVMISGESNRLDLNQLVKSTVNSADPADKFGGDKIPPKNPPGPTAPVAPADPEAVKAARDKIRKTYADIIDAVIAKRSEDDVKFREKYSNLKGDTLLLNLVAFMDLATTTDGDNREKKDYYSGVTPTPYSPKDAPLVSNSELSMVKGFDDTIAALVSNLFTLQPTSGVNVNKASNDLLQGLIPELSKDDLEKVIKRREDTNAGGNFKTAEEFWTFLNTINNFDDAKKRITDSGIQILGNETSYRVNVSGESGMVHKSWVASVGTMAPLSAADKAEAQQQSFQNPPPVEAPKNPTDGTATPAKVSDDSLRIIYLKAD